jgi:hypothetical protein
MVKIVKSAVKCYKKKTKKTVGGQRKTYEYNQYLVPLKKSDKLECSDEVFIIPQEDLTGLMEEDGQLEDFIGQKEQYQNHMAQYETELAELEFKHGELSKSYRNLFNKHSRARRKLRELLEKMETLENDKKQLSRWKLEVKNCLRG